MPSCKRIWLTVQPYKRFYLRQPIRDIQADFQQVIRQMYWVQKFFSYEYTRTNILPILRHPAMLREDCSCIVLQCRVILGQLQVLKHDGVAWSLWQGVFARSLSSSYRARFRCTDLVPESTSIEQSMMQIMANNWKGSYRDCMRQLWRFH